MHKNIIVQKVYRLRILWVIIFLFFNMSHHVACTTLSFDILFPMTWYEKGLNATIFVWHKICSFFDTSLLKEAESLDVILGKCAFAYFCLEKMQQSQQAFVDEDIVYFSSLVHALENKLLMYSYDDELEDQIMCLEYMVMAMKNRLNIPPNINAK